MHAQAGDLAPLERKTDPMVTIGNKGWMLVWAGVSVFAVLCVYAAVSN
jgi:hypothetical protein